MISNQIIFREDQRVRNPILWITLVVVSSGLMGTALWMLVQHFQKRTDANALQQVDTLMVGLAVAIMLLNGGLLLFVALLKMQVEVTTEGLYIRFLPIQFKTRQIDLTDVVTVAAVAAHRATARHWDSTVTLADGLCLTTSRDIMEAIAIGEGPEATLVCLGYAGWDDGQLEQELADNVWLSVASSGCGCAAAGAATSTSTSVTTRLFIHIAGSPPPSMSPRIQAKNFIARAPGKFAAQS